MAAICDAVQLATSASAFSNGKDQAISNTAVLNAGGNIIYFEWNSQKASESQTSVGTSHSGSNPESLHRTFDSVPEAPPVMPHLPDGSSSSRELPLPEAIVTSDSECDSDELPKSSSESSVSVTPSYKTEFLSSEALLQAPSSCEVYVRHIYPLKYGYPLWLPQPDRNFPKEYRRKGVSIGDLGIITPDGAFDYLLNIWLPAEHPINPDDLPDDFDAIPRPRLRTSFQTLFNPGGMVSNMNIESHTNETLSETTYTCRCGDKGAILSLPDGAHQENLKNELHLKEFIAKNALDWYTYARQSWDHELDRHSLYLVTGCIKSRSWGIATFDTVVPERNGELVIGESRRGSSYIWKKSGGAASFRTGPSPDPDLNISGNENEIENQCLFLRGFKISLSKETWDSVRPIKDTAINNENGKRPHSPDESSYGPRDSKKPRIGGGDDASGAEHSCHSTKGNDICISYFPAKTTPFHPLNAVNDMLLSQIPGARIAITHDDQWPELTDEVNYDTAARQQKIRDRFVVSYREDSRTCSLEGREHMLLMSPNHEETWISSAPQEIHDSANRSDNQIPFYFLEDLNAYHIPSPDRSPPSTMSGELLTPFENEGPYNVRLMHDDLPNYNFFTGPPPQPMFHIPPRANDATNMRAASYVATPPLSVGTTPSPSIISQPSDIPPPDRVGAASSSALQYSVLAKDFTEYPAEDQYGSWQALLDEYNTGERPRRMSI